MQCEICGQEVKNLGVHKYHKHKETLDLGPGNIIAVDNPKEIVVDEFTEKPLSELISEIKGVIKKYRHEIDIRVSERGGRVSEIELRVRIQV